MRGNIGHSILRGEFSAAENVGEAIILETSVEIKPEHLKRYLTLVLLLKPKIVMMVLLMRQMMMMMMLCSQKLMDRRIGRVIEVQIVKIVWIM